MSLLSKVTEMSWATPGIDESRQSYRFSDKSAKRVALTMFLAVVTSLFFLFIMAYAERMELGDWNPLAEPRILWFNTALLALASFAMQKARRVAAAGRAASGWLGLSGVLVIGFLVGQLAAWSILNAEGLYSMANPALAFFVVLTALHGLHLLGGLFVWGRTLQRSLRGVEIAELQPTIDLCAVYWHYLLLIWVVLFVLLLNT